MSKSRSGQTVSDRTADNNCVVCCREVSIYAIGECDHPVCDQCATRMRVLCKQNECPICRRDLPKVYFCKERKLFSVAANAPYPFYDRKYSLYFEDRDVQQAHYKLIEHACNLCNQRPVFDHFNALKDHVRKVHDLFYCDICVKHLMIFTQERKCYSRQDLARHRRVGDVDDTSHRGHPLCEFCDERYLDSDELYRHLRREHFYCHFCDLDGLNHYYSDYEYLRKHFRIEHYLCEEGECLNEKFTTAFRTEIDLKAHRATVHNKGLSKAQVKQARTLELEFTIAPRGAGTAGNDLPSASGYYRGEESNPRRGRRGGHGGSHRGGSYHSRVEDPMNEYNERYPTPPNIAPVLSSIDMNSSHDFPILGVTPAVGSSTAATCSSGPPGPTINDSSSSGSAPVDTLARKLAKLNRFTVGNSHGSGGGLDDEFPALHPVKAAMSGPASGSQKMAGANKSWGSTGLATLSLTSSRAPVPNAHSKKILTLKLNSQEEFPGLGNGKRQGVAAPNVSIQVSRKQNVANSSGAPWEGPVSSRPAAKPYVVPDTSSIRNSKSQPVVVTRLESSQNITFLNPPPSTANVHSSDSNTSAAAASSVSRRDSESGLSQADSSNWYVLKKGGKATKRNSVPNEFSTTTEEFPALEVRNVQNASKKETSITVPIGNSWKSLQPPELKNSKSASTNENPATNHGSQKVSGKNKKKKSKASANNVNEATGAAPKLPLAPSANGDKNASPVDVKTNGEAVLDRNKEKATTRNAELKIEKLSPTQEAEVSNGYQFVGGDFPSLAASKPVSTPPPGFSKIEAKSARPPPGFILPTTLSSAKVTKPPPGFNSVVSVAAPLAIQSPTTPTSVTFTNSSGQNFVLPGPIPPAVYLPPEGFKQRNAELTAALLRILDDDKFSTFKNLSAKFRQAEITGAKYYEWCSQLMDKDTFNAVFPELLVLLPDISKQQELLTAHNLRRKQQDDWNQNGSQFDSSSGNIFLVCASCQQVLAGKDFRSHETSHRLNDNFPSLGNPLQTSHVSWVTNN